MKKKPDKKLVLAATVVVLAGMAGASLSKGFDVPKASQHDSLKKTLLTGAFRA
jgi:hypothetical protein